MMPGNPVVGSTVLRRPAIQSPNFVTTVSGWTINADGSAEFNNVTVRGTIAGTDYVINSSGLFVYSGAPAAGNLIASIAAASGTDGFGNAYQPGLTSYDATGQFAEVFAGTLFVSPAGIGAGSPGTVSTFGPGSTAMLSGSTGPSDTDQAAVGVGSAGANLIGSGVSGIVLSAKSVALNETFSATIPYPSAGITTLAQLISALKQVAILS